MKFSITGYQWSCVHATKKKWIVKGEKRVNEKKKYIKYKTRERKKEKKKFHSEEG